MYKIFDTGTARIYRSYAWLFVLVFCGTAFLFALSLCFISARAGENSVALKGMAVLFGLLTLVGWLGKVETRVDFSAGTVTVEKGRYFLQSRVVAPLKEVSRIKVSKQMAGESGSVYLVWLEFPARKPVSVGSLGTAEKAKTEAEYLAGKLGVAVSV